MNGACCTAQVKECFQSLKTPEWQVVDGAGSIEDIHQLILGQADTILQQCSEGAPVRRLWDYQPLVQEQ